MKRLEPDRRQIATFAAALFKRATPGNFVSLRAFRDDKSNKVFKITPHKLNGNLNTLIDRACRDAEFAANDRNAIVFCPPIASFHNSRHAGEADLVEGFALSVECDAHAQQARAKLRRLLGPPTLVVASGGAWIDPKSGELKPKLHLHYRLRKPAHTKKELKNLKLARKLAAAIVGADRSNVTAVHPIRWPGSWHRKNKPQLCRIVAVNAKVELDLGKALRILQKAVPPKTLQQIQRRAKRGGGNKNREPIDRDLIVAALEVIPAEHYRIWFECGCALHQEFGDAGFELFDRWSATSRKYNARECAEQWRECQKYPAYRGATILHYANLASPAWRRDYEQTQWQKLSASMIAAKRR